MKLTPFALAASACLVACGDGVPAATAVKEGPCARTEAWQDELRSLPTGALLGVSAEYLRDTCSGTAQVAATSLLLRNPEASAERFKRLLECPSARFVVSDARDGILPEGIVEIDVRAYAGNYAVTLRADSVAKNIQLFRKARALAKARGASGS